MAGFTIYQLARLMSGDKNKENYIPPQGSAPLILIYGAFFFQDKFLFYRKEAGQYFHDSLKHLGFCKMD